MRQRVTTLITVIVALAFALAIPQTMAQTVPPPAVEVNKLGDHPKPPPRLVNIGGSYDLIPDMIVQVPGNGTLFLVEPPSCCMPTDPPTPFPKPTPDPFPRPKPIDPRTDGWKIANVITLNLISVQASVDGTAWKFGPNGWSFKECEEMALYNLDQKGAPQPWKDGVRAIFETHSAAMTEARAPLRDAFWEGLDKGLITGSEAEINQMWTDLVRQSGDVLEAGLNQTSVEITAKLTDCNRCDGCTTSVCCPKNTVSSCQTYRAELFDCIPPAKSCNVTEPKPKSTAPTIDTRLGL